MADDREQRNQVMELMGEGSARWIRLTVLFTLALSGIVLQGLVYWYALGRDGEIGSGFLSYRAGARKHHSPTQRGRTACLSQPPNRAGRPDEIRLPLWHLPANRGCVLTHMSGCRGQRIGHSAPGQ